MLKFLLISTLCLTASLLKAQKVLNKSWEASLFESIEVISDEVFLVEATAETTDQITLKATIAGENASNVVLDISEENGILTVDTGFSPYFQSQNDKLAAHKVLSIELFLTVPENINLMVQSRIASVRTTGNFKTIEADLFQGNCQLEDFQGNGRIFTRHGNITVMAAESVLAKVNSRRGTVLNELTTGEKFTLVVKSVNGDISLLKTQ